MKQGSSTGAGLHPEEPTCLLGDPLGQIEGLEGSGLCCQGGHMCRLASNQGGRRPMLMAATSPHFPAPNPHPVGLLV